MLIENPEEIQLPRFARPGSTPIILIHDGGGTCFAYHCLDPLARPVYGIHNPRFHAGLPWGGGLPEMAQVYLAMIRKLVEAPSFPGVSALRYGEKLKIMLGGWSLGGLLALQIAWLLDADDDIEVVGILMVDSVYPVLPARMDRKVEPRIEMGENLTKTQKLVSRAMELAGKAVREWTPPEWGWETGADTPSSSSSSSSSSSAEDPDAELAVKKIWGCDAQKDGESRRFERIPAGPPPTILLRAKNYVPTFTSGISVVDIHREDMQLGWSRYHPRFLSKVMELDGHHFDIFAFKNLAATSAVVKDACDLLERGG